MPPRRGRPPRNGRGGGGAQTQTLDLSRMLVLQDFLVQRLGCDPLGDELLREQLKRAERAARQGNDTAYLTTLRAARLVVPDGCITDERLTFHNGELIRITAEMNAGRGDRKVRWTFYQWASLMLAALYMDALHADRVLLREQLNAHLEVFNESRGLRLPPYASDELSRFAFWLATGSGKTLLMHANLHQYRSLAREHDRSPHRYAIVLVPTETLADQHEKELRLSGFKVRRFVANQEQGETASQYVQVVVITNVHAPAARGQPPTAAKEKMFPPEVFGTDNLLMVDEGHKGNATEDGRWMKIRRYLGRDGFTFEYSATFREVCQSGIPSLVGDAAAGGSLAVGDAPDEAQENDDVAEAKVAAEYARCIGIDYAFARWHKDGYGKHFRVLALTTRGATESETARKDMEDYLTGCLLAFFEQLHAFDERDSNPTGPELALRYQIERPLLVFAGLTVRGGEDSDIIQTLAFFGRFLTRRKRYEPVLQTFLDQRTVVVTRDRDDGELDTFAGMFREVRRQFGRNAPALYDAMVKRIFRADTPGALHACDIKGAAGEIRLSVGTFPPFGVVNVGDKGEVLKNLEEQGAASGPWPHWSHIDASEAGASLFKDLERPDSEQTILVGSRKFMEGWDCYRVSMFGILNIGQGVGAQIVQLFGRGVRLRGRDNSLKRTSRDEVTSAEAIPGEERLRVLETVSLFTVNARYLKAFQEQVDGALKAKAEKRYEPVDIRILGEKTPPKLRVLVFPDNDAYTDRVQLTFGPDSVDPPSLPFTITRDYYPRAALVKARGAAGAGGGAGLATRESTSTTPEVFALLDHDALYDALSELRAQNKWWNLTLPRFVGESAARRPLTRWLLESAGWFLIELEHRYIHLDRITSFHHLPLWQRIARDLVRECLEHWYVRQRSAWQRANAKIRWMHDEPKTRDDIYPRDFFTTAGAHHHVLVPLGEDEQAEDSELVMFVRDVKAAVEYDATGTDKKHEGGGFRAFGSYRSLANPYLWLKEPGILGLRVQPTPLQGTEADLVDKLNAFVAARGASLGADLHLIRNEARRGLGFFAGANFYPDFSRWITKPGRQWMVFIDPKGLAHIGTKETAEKVRLPIRLWEIEKRNHVTDPGTTDLRLDAFIVSGTGSAVLDGAVLATHEAEVNAAGGNGGRVVFLNDSSYFAVIVDRAMGRAP